MPSVASRKFRRLRLELLLIQIHALETPILIP